MTSHYKIHNKYLFYIMLENQTRL